MDKPKERFANIFSEGRIRGYKTKNRVKYAACSISNFNTTDGFITDREVARDEVIASTTAGIITNQAVSADRNGEGKAYVRQVFLSDDTYLPGLTRVAETYRKGNKDAVLLQQLVHGGRYGGIDLDYCLTPSDVPQTLRHFRNPREMTKDEITRTIQEHTDTSKRAIQAGFDGIEINGFLGYLVSNFNSKFTNRRQDEYGGTVENRARFMCEMIEAIRKTIGDKYIIGIRLNGTELLDEFGGNSEEECIVMMQIAESAGVDFISIVVGWHESRRPALIRHLPNDHWLYLAENARKKVKVPLAFGPDFSDPVIADKVLSEGTIDFWEL